MQFFEIEEEQKILCLGECKKFHKFNFTKRYSVQFDQNIVFLLQHSN